MSLTPTSPNFNIKTFWQRPEGKTGAIVLVATGIAGIYGISLALPWAIAFATDMLHLGFEVGALFACLYVITNKQFRSIIGNIFRSSMRFLTQMVVEIDPIGILKNNLDKMREQRDELDKSVGGCAGAKKQLENNIVGNKDIIDHARSLAEQADRQAQNEKDPLKKNSYMLRKAAQMQEIGRRLKSTDNFQKILDQTNRMYNMLIRWQQYADFNIENTEATVKNAEEERKSILATYRGLSAARRLLRGDPEELKLVNASLEYLAQDNANKLGEMEDFSRYSEKFLTDMDLESGANETDAEKMLAGYEQKLLSGSSAPLKIPGMNMPTAQGVPVARSISGIDGDYV